MTNFQITIKAKADVIELVKQGEDWKVMANKKTFNADKAFIASLIDQLEMLKPQRVVATSKDKWKEYEVDDSASAKLAVYEGDEQVANLAIGKFNFKQSPNPYMQRQSITSFVRMIGETDVYAVDGMLSLSFMRGADDYRDKTIVKAKVTDINKITFTYPADSSFVIEKKNDKWFLQGNAIDSASIQGYLNQFSNLSTYDILDERLVTNKTPLYAMKIESALSKPVEVFAYPSDTVNGTIIESSVNKGTFFSGLKSGIQANLFVSKSKFSN